MGRYSPDQRWRPSNPWGEEVISDTISTPLFTPSRVGWAPLWKPSPLAGEWLQQSRMAQCGPPSAHNTTSYTVQILHWHPEKYWVSCFEEIEQHVRKIINLPLSQFITSCLSWISPASNMHSIDQEVCLGFQNIVPKNLIDFWATQCFLKCNKLLKQSLKSTLTTQSYRQCSIWLMFAFGKFGYITQQSTTFFLLFFPTYFYIINHI